MLPVIRDINYPVRNFGNQIFQMEEHLAEEVLSERLTVSRLVSVTQIQNKCKR